MATLCTALVVASGCQADPPPKVWPDDFREVMDPATCEECHPEHYRQWQGSMHAYAADDPVFVAMNQRGQRETNGELGDFCIKCHAPLAVELGATVDGLDVNQLERWQKGVTCYFCHNVVEVEGTHNNPFKLAKNDMLRAAIADPVPNPAHDASYGRLLHNDTFESAKMCGACHDIVTPAGVFLERTYAEWQSGFYSDPSPNDPDRPALYAQTCSHCHMDSQSPRAIADFEGARGDRTYHDHRFAGVDLALTPFPSPELAPQAMADQLDGIATQRVKVVCASLCVTPASESASAVTLWLHSEAPGHHWPSGAAQDRRAWVELIASAGGVPVFESGVVADDQPITSLADDNLWLLRDTLLDAAGNDVHMFWQAASVHSNLLEVAPVGKDASTWVSRSYEVAAPNLDSVVARMRLRAMGLDVLDDLISTGDLDPAIRTKMGTADIPLRETGPLTWTPETAEASPLGGSCVHTSLSCYAPGSKPPSP